MLERIDALRRAALAEIGAARQADALEAARVSWLGRKGPISEALRGVKDAPPAERRELGLGLNRLREELEAALEARRSALEGQEMTRRIAHETVDVTLPGRPRRVGGLHPIELAQRSLVDALHRLGFAVAEGPEVESEAMNFEALNIPKDHPAREMQDTFYVEGLPGQLLRTHTSPVQIRAMRRAAPGELRAIAPGRVYRRDDDVTHSPVFHQIEGIAVGRGIGMQHLKATLHGFARAVFGDGVKIRMRPSYFPFTEPSAEVDIGCVFCDGRGCRVCKGSGWIEILGSGMIHPYVLRAGGYDPEQHTGFAFGLGIERVAMLRYGIDDVRLLYQGDLRFLRQF